MPRDRALLLLPAVFCVLLGASVPASAAWIGTCHDLAGLDDIRVLDTYLTPTGRTQSVIAADAKPAGCTLTELPVAARSLRWGRIVSHSEAATLSRGVLLQTARGETHVSPPQEIIPMQSSPAAASFLPFATDLLPKLTATAFGIEGRAAAHQQIDGVTLECRAGQQPAGMLLRSRESAPLPAGAAFTVDLDIRASGNFRFGAADARHERLGEPLALGQLTPASTAARFAVPVELQSTAWQFWVVNCPAGSAQLDIRALRLEPKIGAPVPRRALWIWEPSAWLDKAEATLRLLAEQGADTAFITVPLSGNRSQVADAAALSRFILRATQLGMSIWAVAGDPRAVLPGEREVYAAMARAYAAYNRSVDAQARLAGLQLDIEPYLNRGYHIDTELWLTAYLDTIAAVRAQAAMPIDVAVPFWWGRQPYQDGLFLDRLGPLVEVVTIMNYRTERQQILDAAAPFLAWSAQSRKPVRIGLEAGPLPDESLHAFRPGASGTLWLVPHGSHTMMLLLDAESANPAGTTLAHSHSIQRSGSNTTFHQNIDALRRLLPELERTWRAWPTFGGIALHGFEPGSN